MSVVLELSSRGQQIPTNGLLTASSVNSLARLSLPCPGRPLPLALEPRMKLAPAGSEAGWGRAEGEGLQGKAGRHKREAQGVVVTSHGPAS